MSATSLRAMVDRMKDELNSAEVLILNFAQKGIKRSGFTARKHLQTLRGLALETRKMIQDHKAQLPVSHRRKGTAPTAALAARAEKRAAAAKAKSPKGEKAAKA